MVSSQSMASINYLFLISNKHDVREKYGRIWNAQNGLNNQPEKCVSGSSLDWYRNRQAITVYKIAGNESGSESFDLKTWSPISGDDVYQYYYVNRGTLGIFFDDKK
ncbi:unnamed protein product [Rotaria sordida]|uniref:Uncharacterized protein n=1 Tax=Rotaria sordida TaxID=392033 RepID=A0A815PQS9_9BILA|nr:unnamed protein product [Rotaria sordida]